MEMSLHYQRRMANRGFRERYLEILLRYADYIEQKGRSYVLRLTQNQAQEAFTKLASEEDELLHREKMLTRQKRQARVGLGEASCEAMNHLDSEIHKVRRSRKELRKLKKSIKPGHAVFGVDHDSGAVKGVTVAATLKAIRGECLIKED
ncbi:hypothetical protein ACMG4M_05830 [Alcanivorax sp. IL3]|uniref:hypothetical protein n=1 Tax=unclassified Alcanivorax TaxID=2638842 RepID=UPI0039C214B7